MKITALEDEEIHLRVLGYVSIRELKTFKSIMYIYIYVFMYTYVF